MKPKFSDKEYQEILKVRERLAERKVKDYGYPLGLRMEEPEPIVKPKFIYFKNDIRALELNRRVTELKNSNRYLLEKVKELTAKRKRYKTYG